MFSSYVRFVWSKNYDVSHDGGTDRGGLRCVLECTHDGIGKSCWSIVVWNFVKDDLLTRRWRAYHMT